MSFLRHREIYPSDGGVSRQADAPAHRLDEFPTGYSLAGWSPPEPASASPAGSQYAVQSSCRSRDFQRTANSVLTVCVSPGGRPIPGPSPNRKEPWRVSCLTMWDEPRLVAPPSAKTTDPTQLQDTARNRWSDRVPVFRTISEPAVCGAKPTFSKSMGLVGEPGIPAKEWKIRLTQFISDTTISSSDGIENELFCA